MSRIIATALVVIAFSCYYGVPESRAQCFDNGWATYSYTEVDAPGVAIICPKGDGSLSTTVEIWILNNCLEPLANPTPADNLKITWAGGTGTCSLDSPDEWIRSWETIGNGAWHADFATDALTGKTYLSTSGMCGSGFAGRYRLMVERVNTVFPQPPSAATCLAIDVRSPDFNNDGAIDVIDFAFFGTYYNQSCGAFDPSNPCHRADLNGDGAVSSVDFAVYGTHHGHGCTDCPRSVSASCN